MSRAQVVTKIVWHGAARVGAKLVNQIIQMYLGNYVKAAISVASAIANVVKLPGIKHGKIFKVRNWKSLTTVNQ